MRDHVKRQCGIRVVLEQRQEALELGVIDSLEQVEDNALEGGHVRTSVPHRGDTDVAILDLHRGASIDDNEDFVVTGNQVQSSLLHADVRLATV